MEQLSTVFSRQESDLNGNKRLLTITLHKSSSSFSPGFPLSMQVKKAEPKVNVAKADLTWCDIYLHQFDIFITLKCWQSSAWGCQAPAPRKPRPQSWRDSEWLCGHAVQEASRQPAKSTVTKTSVRLKVLHLLDIKTQLKFIDFYILSSRCRQFLILSQSMQWYYRIPSFWCRNDFFYLSPSVGTYDPSKRFLQLTAQLLPG